MPRRRQRKLLFPAGGLERRFGYQAQRPYTTADALNVRPDATIEGRERGGSRPGLEHVPNFGNGRGPINMLAAVPWTTDLRTPEYIWRETFSNGPQFDHDNWVIPEAAPLAEAPWQVNPGHWRVGPRSYFHHWFDPGEEVSDDLHVIGLIAPHITKNPLKQYELAVEIMPSNPYSVGAIQIFFAMADDDPDAYAHSIRLTAEFPVYNWVHIFADGFGGDQFGWPIYDEPSFERFGTHAEWLRIVCDPLTGRVKVYWGDVDPANIKGNFAADIGSENSRWGIALVVRKESEPDTWSGMQLHEARVKFSGLEQDIPPVRPVLFVGEGGKVHYETESAGLAVIEAGPLEDPIPAISTEQPIYAVDYLQQLFIADVVKDVVTEPKVAYYDSEAEKWLLKTWKAREGVDQYGQNFGVIEPSNPLIARYNQRIVLAGSPPQVLYMSGIEDPFSWNYGSGVDGHAEAVALGEPITALAAWRDDYLIVGCVRSLWVMRGDIGFGGQFDNLSRVIGIISQGACCMTPDGTLIFLSADGLYALPPGATTEPQSVSRERLPRALVNIDPMNTIISMAYDVEFRGIHIFLKSRAGGGALSSWWFDWETKGFWPSNYQGDHQPITVLSRQSTDAAFVSGVLLGCQDGGIRRHVATQANDDGTSFDSHVLYGPIRTVGNDMDDGILAELLGSLAAGSGLVEWSIHPGNTAEEAFQADAQASGVWGAGTNYLDHPRVRGNTFFLKLKNGDGTLWAVEQVNCRTQPAGRQRLL